MTNYNEYNENTDYNENNFIRYDRNYTRNYSSVYSRGDRLNANIANLRNNNTYISSPIQQVVPWIPTGIPVVEVSPYECDEQIITTRAGYHIDIYLSVSEALVAPVVFGRPIFRRGPTVQGIKI